jgi:hypothetical protein
MNSTISFKLRSFLAMVPLLAGVFLAAQAPTPQPAAAPPAQSPEVAAKINALAHRLLDAGVKSNGLNGGDLKPWHMKVDIELPKQGQPKPETATLEVWWMGPYQWKRVYTSNEAHLKGEQWSVSRFEQYRSKPGLYRFDPRDEDFNPLLRNQQVARPVIDPLYQAANIKPETLLTIKRINMDGTILNCVGVANPSDYGEPDDVNVEYHFPATCFDNDMHLRATSTTDANVVFSSLQPFQNRSIAREVKVVSHGMEIAEMKVSLLEPWTTPDAELLKPGKNAVSEPYRIEAGLPKPEPVHEEGISAVIMPNGFHFQGVIIVPIVIRKDGSVYVDEKGVFPPGPPADAAKDVISHWKYKPYLVDGQPVEVGYTVRYMVDNKPYVPSYDRPKAKPAAASSK